MFTKVKGYAALLIAAVFVVAIDRIAALGLPGVASFLVFASAIAVISVATVWGLSKLDGSKAN